MPDASSFRSVPLAAALAALLAAAPAQEQPATRRIDFVPQREMVRLAVHDLPALLERSAATPLGTLFAEADVRAAFDTGAANYHRKVRAFLDLVEAAQRIDASLVDADALATHAVYSLDWRDFRSVSLSAVVGDADPQPFPLTLLRLYPKPEAEGRLQQRFAGLTGALAKHAELEPAPEQEIDGHPACVLRQRGAGFGLPGAPQGLWLLHLPGLFASATGRPADAGRCAPATPAEPGIELVIDLLAYVELMATLTGEMPEEMQTTLRVTGAGQTGAFRWLVDTADGLVRDRMSLELKGRPEGLLRAILEGMAPLPAQPLPDGALLQLRLAIDVRQLLAVFDDLLAAADLPSTTRLGIDEDLRKAWTGGLALALCRPAGTGVVPRIYASFGIADREAAGRLLDQLRKFDGVGVKDVEYEGKPSTQLLPGGAPPAIQPAYCLDGDVLHFAETGASLRALLKAVATGKGEAMDVGDAPLPKGPGTPLPTFDLRYDGAAIWSAIHEVWEPLWRLTMRSENNGFDAPLVPADDGPDVRTVVPHLRAGRGVMRRLPDRIVLETNGTLGGPFLTAFVAAYGPMFSGPMTSQWEWQCRQLSRRVGTLQLQKVHEAIEAFAKRTGKRPASLGELVAAKDLDIALLSIPGSKTEPVTHDGRELGVTSFRYYAEPIEIAPEGNPLKAVLVELQPMPYQRLVLCESGTIEELWSLAERSVEDIEATAKNKQAQNEKKEQP